MQAVLNGVIDYLPNPTEVTNIALDQLGKDAQMLLLGDAPLPAEYGFMPLEGLLRRVPADASERILLAVDCAKEERLGPDPSLLERALERRPEVVQVAVLGAAGLQLLATGRLRRIAAAGSRIGFRPCRCDS